MKKTITWIFPMNIMFEQVSHYMLKFNCEDLKSNFIFDLHGTVDIHSSFVGFLIHAKNIINMNGGELKIILSERLEEIFCMLNIIDHFSSEIENVYDAKEIAQESKESQILTM